MKNLFKNFRKYKLATFLILLFLMGQAFCDMNGPRYMQDLIDTGIQNQGVSHILPERINSQEYNLLRAMMTEEQAAAFDSVYDLGGMTYECNASGKLLEELDEELIVPVIMRYFSLQQMASGDSALTSSPSPLASLSIEDLQAKISDEIDKVGSETIKAMGIAYSAMQEKAAGVDMNAKQSHFLWLCGTKMVLISLGMLVFTILVSYLAARVGAGIGRDLRSRLFTNVMTFSSAEIGKFHTSSLITRATNDIQQVQMTSTLLLRMLLYAPCVSFWAIIKVSETKAHMNFVIISAISLISLLMILILAIAMPKFRIMQKLIDGLNSVSREMLTGLQVIRAFGREKTEEERFETANNRLYRTQLFVNRVLVIMSPLLMIIMYALTIWITWTGAHRIDSGTLQVGAMTAFITYSMMIVTSFLMIAGMAIFLPRAGIAADRINEVLTTKSSIVDSKQAVSLDNPSGTIQFKDVSFRFPDGDEDVLSHISFTAKPGETTAIIGSTGSGKSALVNLIPRFYDVTLGEISFDGVDIRDIKLSSLRDAIGYVPQKATLFSGTIESNIKFGNPKLSDEIMEEAASISQSTEFIDDKSDRYETEISQGGTNVSGGQKQRLSIARAIAKSPRVYIFDDSFSALDMKTDAALRRTLELKAKDATIIVVAQRVSTILGAEQIIVLDDGEIVGLGTHQELMKSCTEYREIAESQLSEQELNSLK